MVQAKQSMPEQQRALLAYAPKETRLLAESIVVDMVQNKSAENREFLAPGIQHQKNLTVVQVKDMEG